VNQLWQDRIDAMRAIMVMAGEALTLILSVCCYVAIPYAIAYGAMWTVAQTNQMEPTTWMRETAYWSGTLNALVALKAWLSKTWGKATSGKRDDAP
jgi:hypothetical protein